MSELFRPHGKSYSYTEEELDKMGEILLVADEIRRDDKVFRLVKEYLEEKGEKITRIQDLRDIQAEGDSERRVQ